MRTNDRDSMVPFEQPEVPAPGGWPAGALPVPGAMQPGAARVQVPQSSLLEIIYRRWQRIAIIAGVCMFLALVYCLFARPLYSGKASLLVSEMGHPLLATSNGGSNFLNDNFLYTQTTIIDSTPIIRAAVESGNFNTMRTFAGVTDIVGVVQGNLDVELGKKDGIITLIYDAYTPQDASQITDSIVKAYLDYQTSQVQSTAGTVKDMLKKELDKQSLALAEKESSLITYKAANGTLSLTDSDKGNIIMQKLLQISTALTQSELDAINEKANWDAAKLMLTSPVQRSEWLKSQSANSRSAYSDDTAQKNLANWQLHLNQLRNEYAENHPIVHQAKVMIEQLQQQVDQSDQMLIDGYIATLKQTYEKTLERKTALKAEFDEQQKAVAALNSTAVEEAKLEDDVKQGQRMCDSLDARIKEMSVMQGSIALNTTVVEPAAAPSNPNKPYRARIMIGALAVGLLFGFGYAWLGENNDRRFHSAEEVQSTLGLPVFTVIPHMNRAAAAHGRLVQLDPMSPVAEAFRSLRTALNFAVPVERTKTLLITSATAGDGKSTVVSNLAIAMAQAGRRVLVLDADFRKPSQHKIFDIDDSIGISSVLAGTSTLENAIRRVNVDRVDILPCGPLPANPSEILNSEMFKELLAQITDKYDHVLLDSPPVTAVADARILSAMCDGTLLVVRAGKSTQRMAENACDALMSVGGTMHGMIMNDVAQRSLRNGYQYGYGFRNGMGRSNGDVERIRVRIHDRPAAATDAGLLQ